MVDGIRSTVGLRPTGRPAKSTTSIIAKLQRESIRLSQVQDIAGCRVIVTDIVAQERAVRAIGDAFPETTVIDRREAPSHGYRAIHLVASLDGCAVEVQVRTSLQHLWAEFSEKLSDVVHPGIKYGRGDPTAVQLLADISATVAAFERLEGTERPTMEPPILSEYKRRLHDLLEQSTTHAARTWGRT